MSTNAPAKPSRRRFFALSAGAGVAATAAVVGTQTAPAPAADPRADKRAGKGYQETAHVRNYYRTTQI